MQKATQLFVIFLVAALLTVGIASLLGTRIGGDGGRPGPGPELGPVTTQPQATAERLREVQDAYLRILRDYPTDAAAMRGLVVVRRHLAGDDPVVLRRQAVAYQQMAASGVESPEHYSQQTMKVLAAASLQAAATVESEQRSIAQRSSRPGPPDKGAFTPPALPMPPVQRDKRSPRESIPAPSAQSKSLATAPPGQLSEGPPVQPGAPTGPPAPSQSTAQPAMGPAPEPPPVPPSGSTTSQQPSTGQAPPGAGTSEGTIAVVPPPTSGPGAASSEGSLASVDCQKKSFVIHGPNGDEEYLTAPTFTIYLRGVVSERLTDFCGLRRHLGRAAVVWSVPDGDRKIAKSMSVVLPPQ